VNQSESIARRLRSRYDGRASLYQRETWRDPTDTMAKMPCRDATDTTAAAAADDDDDDVKISDAGRKKDRSEPATFSIHGACALSDDLPLMCPRAFIVGWFVRTHHSFAR